MKHVNCSDPTCRNYLRYCRIHKQEVIKPAKSIAKVSDPMKDKLKVYRKAAAQYIAKHKLCELKMEGCEVEAKCVHHTKSREGDFLLDQKFWKPNCYHCNLQVEIKDHEARIKDLKLSKFNNKTTNA